jgi:hypothetical protein
MPLKTAAVEAPLEGFAVDKQWDAPAGQGHPNLHHCGRKQKRGVGALSGVMDMAVLIDGSGLGLGERFSPGSSHGGSFR